MKAPDANAIGGGGAQAAVASGCNRKKVRDPFLMRPACRTAYPARRHELRVPAARVFGCVRLVLVGLCLAARVAVAGGDGGGDGGGEGELEGATLERLLWDTASGSGGQGRPNAQARALVALARLWQDDAEALCHVASALASVGHAHRAEAACRRALRVQPREACATFCALHFALWTCDFDSADALRARAIAAVESAVAAGPDAQPARLGHLEALLVLPEHLLVRHLLQQAHFLGAASRGGAVLPTPGPDALQLGAGRAGGALAVALLTSTARQHAHGYALLAALRGLYAFRLRRT